MAVFDKRYWPGEHFADHLTFALMDTVEMPDRLAENLLMFIRQNGGTLPKRRRQNEFKALADKEVQQLEEVVREAFEGFDEAGHAEGAAHDSEIQLNNQNQ
jgi:hypothetical protein